MSDMSSSTTTASESCGKEWKMDSSPGPQYSAISEHSSIKGTPKVIKEWLMSSRPDSRVSRFQLQESSSQKTTNGTCGPKQSKSFAKWDRRSRSWRTYPALFDMTISAKSSETWQRQGSMRNGELSQREALAPHISEDDSGLWPTPTATDWKGFKCSEKWKVRLTSGPGLRLNHWLYLSGRSDLAHSAKFRETIMGWPIGWTDLKPLATDKCRLAWPWHGNHSMPESLIEWFATHGIVLETLTKKGGRHDSKREGEISRGFCYPGPVGLLSNYKGV